jgi:hypothetical protein
MRPWRTKPRKQFSEEFEDQKPGRETGLFCLGGSSLRGAIATTRLRSAHASFAGQGSAEAREREGGSNPFFLFSRENGLLG